MFPSGMMEIPAMLLFILHISFNTLEEGFAINPGCTCITFASTYGKERGTFQSPFYPRNYPMNIDCLLYTFKAAPNEIVEILFSDFDLYKGATDCTRGDYLKVYTEVTQGSELSTGQHRIGVNEYSEWSRILCGSRTEVPLALYSAGPALVLEFHSGHKTSNSTGFIGTFKFLDKRMFETDGSRVAGTECDYIFSSSSAKPSHGRIFSPRYPSNYPNNVRCIYQFQAKDKERIRVLFEEISLQKGDQSCLNRADIIKVFDGPSDKSPSIAMLCNELSDSEVLSTSSNLYIEFTANSDWPGQGFKATYQFHPKEEPNLDTESANRGTPAIRPEVSATTSSCQEVISSDVNKTGFLFSPNYPQPYPAKLVCHYDFSGRGKQRVQLIFKDFQLYKPIESIEECDNFDALHVYVYSDGRLDKIDSFCGNNIPKQIMSNSPKLMLEFRGTVSSRTSRGFKIFYKFIENFGLYSGRQLMQFPCAFVFNSTERKQGTFTSPNFPGPYPRDTECNYFFYGENAEKVHIHFDYFDIEGVSPCETVSSSDYVEFSNVIVKDEKFKRYCGQINHLSVDSDRKFFKVTFRSNSRLDGGGFKANYEFFIGNSIHRPYQSSESSNAQGFPTMRHSIILLCIMLEMRHHIEYC